MGCVFCSIVSGEVPAKVLYQDEQVVAFPDISPVAPVHILIVPRKHIPRLEDVEDMALVGHMVEVARRLAAERGIGERGYRLVINNGPEGTQVVPHLHMHLIGGRKLRSELN